MDHKRQDEDAPEGVPEQDGEDGVEGEEARGPGYPEDGRAEEYPDDGEEGSGDEDGGLEDGAEEPGDEDDPCQEDSPDDEDEAPDLENRILCSDGACIGIIGPDGLCKECGKPLAPEDAPQLEVMKRAAEEAAGAGGDGGEEEELSEEDEADDEAVGAEAALDDIQERKLCPDGACIGVIGADGRCRECGRAAGDVPAE